MKTLYILIFLFLIYSINSYTKYKSVGDINIQDPEEIDK